MKQSQGAWARVVILLLLMAAAGLFLARRGDAEVIRPHEPLALLPLDFGEWQGRSIEIPDEIRDVLGSGDFLQRVYQPGLGGPPVELFMAYFPTQRTGTTIHSPKNCLPGSGWTPLRVAYADLTMPNGRTYPVNLYVIGRGEQRELVLYWYQAHGRAVASEYAAKFYLIADAIRMNRSDGALIRLVTPIGPGESESEAELRERQFLKKLLPCLPAYIPS